MAVVVAAIGVTGFVAQYKLQLFTHVVAAGKLLIVLFSIYLIWSKKFVGIKIEELKRIKGQKNKTKTS